MKKITLIIAMLVCVISYQELLAETGKNEELLEMIHQLQKELMSQQNEIQILQEELRTDKQSSTGFEYESEILVNELRHLEKDSLTAEEERILQNGLAAIKEVAGIKFGKGISGLTLKGDVRFRYEARERERFGRADDSRDRARVRLRLNGVWHNVDENWEAGVGLATGGTGAGSATSTNQSFSKDGVFQTNDINLDFAYVRHSWEDIDLTIGQQKNPWKNSTTFIMWDGDVRPVGITGEFHKEGLFLTGGIYDVLGAEGSSGDNIEVLMLGGQTGYHFEGDEMQFVIAAGIQYFNDNAYEAVNNFFNDPSSGAMFSPGSAGARQSGPLTTRAKFKVADLYAKLNTEIWGLKLQLHSHIANNIGANNAGGSQLGQATIKPESEDLAWVIGVKGKWGQFQLGIDYAHIEADSVFAPIKDSDFGDTAGMTVTDVEGIKIGLKCNFTKTMSLGWTYLDLSEIEGTKRNGELHQLDMIYKF